VRTLEGVFAEQDTLKREVGLMGQLVEKTSDRDLRETPREPEEEDFGSAGARSEDDDARSIRTIVSHEL